MRKIDKPLDAPEEVLRICASRIRDNDLKLRVASCEAAIIAASQELETKAVNSTLHTIATSNNVSGCVTAQEMIKVYTDRMAKKNAPGRPIYNKLISKPAHGRCPLCGQRIVSTLDHYLPKAYYPALAIVPLNLVPSCKDCNTTKIDHIPQTGEDETLHPYFDDVEGDFWLKGSVVESSPATLIFYTDPPPHWGDLLSKRIAHHFNVLGLAGLYGSHAAEELSNIRQSLKTCFDAGGKDVLRAYLQDAACSRAASFKNSWQTAMYSCLADSDWFCEGGFDS